jgi:hypothetical protein
VRVLRFGRLIALGEVLSANDGVEKSNMTRVEDRRAEVVGDTHGVIMSSYKQENKKSRKDYRDGVKCSSFRTFVSRVEASD